MLLELGIDLKQASSLEKTLGYAYETLEYYAKKPTMKPKIHMKEEEQQKGLRK